MHAGKLFIKHRKLRNLVWKILIKIPCNIQNFVKISMQHGKFWKKIHAAYKILEKQPPSWEVIGNEKISKTAKTLRKQVQRTALTIQKQNRRRLLSSEKSIKKLKFFKYIYSKIYPKSSNYLSKVFQIYIQNQIEKTIIPKHNPLKISLNGFWVF